MLLTESEKAKYVRSRILDIVISTINEKTGGGTKYINLAKTFMERMEAIGYHVAAGHEQSK